MIRADRRRAGSTAHIVAARLRELGWLLPTGQRGVWEFAPAAVAGPYSRGGHTRLLRSVLARAEVACGLTFQAAAWAHGLADRAPTRIARSSPDYTPIGYAAVIVGQKRRNAPPMTHGNAGPPFQPLFRTRTGEMSAPPLASVGP
jgi:hypothetical protein